MVGRCLIVFVVLGIVIPSISAGTMSLNKRGDRHPASVQKSPPIHENFIRYQLDGVYKKLVQCTSEYEFIHCLQLYMVERIEKMKNQFGKSGDIKRDFLDKLFKSDGNATLDDFEISETNKRLSNTELNAKLMNLSREYYFKNNREARLELIPGYVLDIKFPESEAEDKDMVNFSIVKQGRQGRKKGKKSDLYYLLQLGIPAAMMPMIMVGSVFPFMFPALKTAAIMAHVLNKAALIGALMYLAKSTVYSDNTSLYQKQSMYYGGAQ